MGNRFFRINEDSTILFRPDKKTKIFLEPIVSKKQEKLLDRIRVQMENKVQPVSFKLSTDYIWITYNEQTLNDFHLHRKEMNKELEKYPKRIGKDGEIIKENIPIKKEISKSFFKEQEQRQLKNKVSNRCMSVDLNPQHEGYSICDYVGDTQVIIEKGSFDLTRLGAKLKLNSKDEKQKYQNNKRKYEICNIWKQIFKLAKHFKVAFFVIEDLNFKPEVDNKKANEGNRQTKNIWHRDLSINLITKYTNQLGIKLIEVNPCYTSFIGNIIYNYFDPTNAALEINRRGFFKFIKGSKLYPEFDLNTALNAMSNINQVDVRDVLIQKGLIENSNTDIKTWQGFFSLTKQTKFKYRRCLKTEMNFKQFSLNNIKSKVILYNFI
jgi:IS605 OrfB family transposase